jgi:D-alanyl-D-alanine carboxypeptidase (penicillin-binding protein 5/6)
MVAGAADLPVIHASAWLVADADTGAVLAAKHAHERLRPASTLKILTAITLLPRLDPRRVQHATYDDAVVEGSRVGIVPGVPYTVRDLFYGMFLPSGNDAARALAEAGGGVSHTVHLMQRTARTMQAMDTHVVNPHGLDAPGQVTSAYDLALFARAGLARADFRRYCSTVTYAFPGRMPKPGHPRSTYQIYNQNPMLVDGFDGAIGVKTGYTTLAGRTFVGAATRHGHTLIVTLMHVQDTSATDAESLLQWGFEHLPHAKPVGQLVAPVDRNRTVPSDDLVASGPVAAAGAGVGLHRRSGWLATVALWLALVVALAGVAVIVRRQQVSRRSRRRQQEWLTGAPGQPSAVMPVTSSVVVIAPGEGTPPGRTPPRP